MTQTHVPRIAQSDVKFVGLTGAADDDYGPVGRDTVSSGSQVPAFWNQH
jgi:hypothetical protein